MRAKDDALIVPEQSDTSELRTLWSLMQLNARCNPSKDGHAWWVVWGGSLLYIPILNEFATCTVSIFQSDNAVFGLAGDEDFKNMEN